MESLLRLLQLNTRFATNDISKEFLQRRVGLGYAMKYQKLDRSVIQTFIKSKRKNEELARYTSLSSSSMHNVNANYDNDDECGRSGIVKKRSVSANSYRT
ncbi:hypothetical protein CWI42_080940 [Ordospora colligata]|uniref:Uncharacterized protein n=1 Tax=Ordospora colligata OC4 TaxID=1354746 RepID=A0A0B2UJ48_9MICR|nr:uncharacterized protein M896_080940 [Ordospora colligata OC4]KHN69358.1 hypothetical protein M896_080940 [Ordospora colligata OC4]TBU14872.1 hypothetical protein CWI41_080930 [Ordospora colligata]TBU15003.1 hypothetical protein CWI40_080950 [Ordospora colligata]TBU18257.1 hypothetical protein CWI42_080940 [Ordospora colligata]